MSKSTKLAIVIPCFNEQEVLPITIERLTCSILRLTRLGIIENGLLIFVDDGSTDNTWHIIEQNSLTNSLVLGLKLSHNVGHQNALWAGLEKASQMNFDATISIDADLQDDIEVFDQMLEAYHEGNDIVFGVRKERKHDSFFKHLSARSFYRLMDSLDGEIIYNHGDFRLMSRKALNALMAFPERNIFLRGMVKNIGFPYKCVYYNRKERVAGKSKYPVSKMINFAFDGITSFSTKPLRFITTLGILFMFVSASLICYGLYRYITDSVIEGWTSLMLSLWFIGGAILTCLGIIGEYIGRIYQEVKNRPRYFIEKETDTDK